MKFRVIAEGLVHSEHDTKVEAEAEMQDQKDRTLRRIEDLTYEIESAHEYANSLSIKEVTE